MMLISVNGPFRTASVGHEYQVLLRQKNPLFHAVFPALDGCCNFSAASVLKKYVCHLCVEPEIHSRIFQISLHGKNQGFVLVVPGEFQRAEVRQAADVMKESLKIQLHFQCAVPVFKGKHGSPVQPESGVKHFIVKHVLYGLVIQILVSGHEKLHDFHTALPAQTEFSIRMRILSPLLRGPAERIIGVMLIQPVKLIQHRCARNLQRGNASKQIPQTLEMILHLPSSPHHISAGRVVDSITGSARNIHGFQNMNALSRHLSVTHQKTGRRKGCQSAPHNIRVFLLHALRLFRPGKSFIVTAAVIDALAVSGILSQFCVPPGTLDRGSLLCFLLCIFP